MATLLPSYTLEDVFVLSLTATSANNHLLTQAGSVMCRWVGGWLVLADLGSGDQ